MMKLLASIFVILASLQLAKCRSVLRSTEENCAQYAMVSFATETTIFRMRANTLVLELNYSVKNNDQSIIELMETLGVYPATINDIKNEMTLRNDKINNGILKVLDVTQTLINTIESTNTHIADDTSQLTSDLQNIKSQIQSVNIASYSMTYDVQLAMRIMKDKIEEAIGEWSGAECDEIRGLLAEAEIELMHQHIRFINFKLDVFDSVAVKSEDALMDFIFTLQ